ncbi:hypothetical protein E8R44_00180 [Escherichia coli]|nr:hypothetical protein E8R44_00180 [Escherichia coli]
MIYCSDCRQQMAEGASLNLVQKTCTVAVAQVVLGDFSASASSHSLSFR